MDFPNAAVSINPVWLLSLGLSVGVLSGFFGVGGGFLVTGGLIVLGVPELFAVGTGLALIMGASIINALKYRQHGHVDLKLGFLMILGALPGVEASKRLLLYLEEHGLEGETIHYGYIVVLALLAAFIIYDYLKARRLPRSTADQSSTGALVEKIRAINLPPLVSLPVSGIPRISAWVLVGIGLSIGLFAGMLGAAGGFLLMPVLVFVLGVPTITAIGTGLFQVVMTGAFGTLTYSLENRVDLLMALIMIAAASVGSQLGTLASSVVEGARIRLLYAFTILAGSAALAVDQASDTIGGDGPLGVLAAVLLLGTAGAMSLLVASLALNSLARRGRQPKLVDNQPFVDNRSEGRP